MSEFMGLVHGKYDAKVSLCVSSEQNKPREGMERSRMEGKIESFPAYY